MPATNDVRPAVSVLIKFFHSLNVRYYTREREARKEGKRKGGKEEREGGGDGARERDAQIETEDEKIPGIFGAARIAKNGTCIAKVVTAGRVLRGIYHPFFLITL